MRNTKLQTNHRIAWYVQRPKTLRISEDTDLHQGNQKPGPSSSVHTCIKITSWIIEVNKNTINPWKYSGILQKELSSPWLYPDLRPDSATLFCLFILYYSEKSTGSKMAELVVFLYATGAWCHSGVFLNSWNVRVGLGAKSRTKVPSWELKDAKAPFWYPKWVPKCPLREQNVHQDALLGTKRP